MMVLIRQELNQNNKHILSSLFRKRRLLLLLFMRLCLWLRRFLSKRVINDRDHDKDIHAKHELKKGKEDRIMESDESDEYNSINVSSDDKIVRHCMDCDEVDGNLLRDFTNRKGTRTLCLLCIRRLRREKKSLYFPLDRTKKKEGIMKEMPCSNCFKDTSKWYIIPTGGYLCIPCWSKIREN